MSYAVSENSTANSRTGTITIAGKNFTITQPGTGSACTVNISPQKITLPSNSTEGDILVNASSSSCQWNAASSDTAWLTINSPVSGSSTGNGTITYLSNENTNTSDRYCAITVNDETFVLTQKGTCTYSLSPVVTNIDASGSSSENATITPSNELCTWTATTEESWLTFNSSTTGTGTGSITYSADANSTDAMRTGKIKIGGENLMVVQSSASSASFSDITGEADIFQSAIYAMMANNITSGCSTGTYCPNDPVTRAQMAVFVLRAVGQDLTDSDLCTGTIFTDVTTDTAGDFFCRAIEKFSTFNITSGCGDNNFCPNGNVTRLQMAVFMLKALGLEPTDSDLCSGVIFNDVTSSIGDYFCKAVEKFKTLNITSGCASDDPNTAENEAIFCGLSVP
ncbi:S-layer homology region domain protein [Candidatus Magnetoovum chiemensis]|nr:S-layer homology region domain protein [Candidatus Magnetoovum chiemensis]